MRFINRHEFANNAQRLVDELFEGSGWDKVKFVDVSGNDFLVICNNQYKYHAYIEDFMLRSFKKDIRNSMIYMKGNNNTIKFLIFMTKLFGKEYVDAYEAHLKNKELSIQESIKDAEKRRDNELKNVLNAIDDIAVRQAYSLEAEKSRKRMRDEAKAQYLATRESFVKSMQEEFERHKEEGLENLAMLRKLLN